MSVYRLDFAVIDPVQIALRISFGKYFRTERCVYHVIDVDDPAFSVQTLDTLLHHIIGSNFRRHADSMQVICTGVEQRRRAWERRQNSVKSVPW